MSRTNLKPNERWLEIKTDLGINVWLSAGTTTLTLAARGVRETYAPPPYTRYFVPGPPDHTLTFDMQDGRQLTVLLDAKDQKKQQAAIKRWCGKQKCRVTVHAHLISFRESAVQGIRRGSSLDPSWMMQ